MRLRPPLPGPRTNPRAPSVTPVPPLAAAGPPRMRAAPGPSPRAGGGAAGSGAPSGWAWRAFPWTGFPSRHRFRAVSPGPEWCARAVPTQEMEEIAVVSAERLRRQGFTNWVNSASCPERSVVQRTGNAAPLSSELSRVDPVISGIIGTRWGGGDGGAPGPALGEEELDSPMPEGRDADLGPMNGRRWPEKGRVQGTGVVGGREPKWFQTEVQR